MHLLNTPSPLRETRLRLKFHGWAISFSLKKIIFVDETGIPILEKDAFHLFHDDHHLRPDRLRVLPDRHHVRPDRLRVRPDRLHVRPDRHHVTPFLSYLVAEKCFF